MRNQNVIFHWLVGMHNSITARAAGAVIAELVLTIKIAQIPQVTQATIAKARTVAAQQKGAAARLIAAQEATPTRVQQVGARVLAQGL